MAEPMAGEIKGVREEAVFLELRAKKTFVRSYVEPAAPSSVAYPYYGDAKQSDFH